MPLFGTRDSCSIKNEPDKAPDDYITINKAFVAEMSMINHEINSKLQGQLVPRFKIPKPDIVFQLTRFKERMSGKKGQSTDVSLI